MWRSRSGTRSLCLIPARRCCWMSAVPTNARKRFIPGSTHIPLDELRERLSELPRDREIITYCQSGQRSYYAAVF